LRLNIEQPSFETTEGSGQFPCDTTNLGHIGLDNLEDVFMKNRGGNIAALPSVRAGGWAKYMGALTIRAFYAVYTMEFTTSCFRDLCATQAGNTRKVCLQFGHRERLPLMTA